jgi:MOSC domain-containing protein YiiM
MIVMSIVEAICTSCDKGSRKKPVQTAEFIPEWGIAEDAHAGRWHRQVSILSVESINRMKEHLPGLSAGAFAENIVTRGLDLTQIRVGDVVRIGSDVILEVTQLGKECHEACDIGKSTGACIMPIEGVFARVLSGGSASPGDTISVGTAPTGQ